jgi:hypothetical protein
MKAEYAQSFLSAFHDSGVSGRMYGRAKSPYAVAEAAFGSEFAQKTARELKSRVTPVSDRTVTGWAWLLKCDESTLRAILCGDYEMVRGRKVHKDAPTIAKANEEARKALLNGQDHGASEPRSGPASRPVLHSDATTRGRL